MSEVVESWLMEEVSGGRMWDLRKFGVMDSVKVAWGIKGMKVERVRRCGIDRKEWKAVLYLQVPEY